MECEQAERIDRAALGALSSDERDALKAHAKDCSVCGPRLEELGYIEALLVGTFRGVVREHRPQRQAVLALIGGRAPESEDDEVERAAEARRAERAEEHLRRRRQRRRVLAAIYAVAAALLLTLYGGYLSLLRGTRDQLARGAQMEARGLALAIEAHLARRGAPLPASGPESIVAVLSEPGAEGSAAPIAALEGERLKDGVLLDAFGHAFRYERLSDRSFRVYSLGPDGRDDRGGGDDLVAEVELAG